MIRIVVQYLAVFLLPLVLYAIYFAYLRRRAHHSGNAVPRWADGPWIWLVFAGAVLVVVAFVLFGLFKGGDPNVLYVPPSGPQ